MEKKEGRTLSQVELEKIWSETIEDYETNKIKYWKCRNGKRTCHGGDPRIKYTFAPVPGRGRPGGEECSLECLKISRDYLCYCTDISVCLAEFHLCLAGLETCNDGLIWCSLCRVHNAVQYKPKWTCKFCDQYFSTFQQCAEVCKI